MQELNDLGEYSLCHNHADSGNTDPVMYSSTLSI